MAGFMSPLEEKVDVEELERMFTGGGVTQEQIDAMEEAFAQEDEAPSEKLLFTRTTNWLLPGETCTHDHTPLDSIPQLRELVMALPPDSFITVVPAAPGHKWFTQCAILGNDWAVECSTRIDGQNHVRTLYKESGVPWTAHEIFLVMATFIRSKKIDSSYSSTLELY